jgi:hypothetical protein
VVSTPIPYILRTTSCRDQPGITLRLVQLLVHETIYPNEQLFLPGGQARTPVHAPCYLVLYPAQTCILLPVQLNHSICELRLMGVLGESVAKEEERRTARDRIFRSSAWFIVFEAASERTPEICEHCPPRFRAVPAHSRQPPSASAQRPSRSSRSRLMRRRRTSDGRRIRPQ